MGKGHYTHHNTLARQAGHERAQATRKAKIALYCTVEYHARRALTHMYCNWCQRRVGKLRTDSMVHTRRPDGRTRVIRQHHPDSAARLAGYAKAVQTRAARIAAECTPSAHAERAKTRMYCGLCRRKVGQKVA